MLAQIRTVVLSSLLPTVTHTCARLLAAAAAAAVQEIADLQHELEEKNLILQKHSAKAAQWRDGIQALHDQQTATLNSI